MAFTTRSVGLHQRSTCTVYRFLRRGAPTAVDLARLSATDEGRLETAEEVIELGPRWRDNHALRNGCPVRFGGRTRHRRSSSAGVGAKWPRSGPRGLNIEELL